MVSAQAERAHTLDASEFKDLVFRWNLQLYILDPGVVSTWNFHDWIFLTKERCHSLLFADTSNFGFWSLKSTWVI